MFRWSLKPVWLAGWDWWAQLKWKRIFSSGQSSAEMWIISINCKTLGSFFIFMHTKANQLCSVWRCWWNTQSLFIQNEGYGVSVCSTAETGSSAWQLCYFVHCHKFPSLQSSQHSSVILEAEPLLPPQKNPVYPGTTHLVIQEKAELCHLQKTCNCLFCSSRRMMIPELIHTWPEWTRQPPPVHIKEG